MSTDDVSLMLLVKIMCLDITSYRHHSNHVVLTSFYYIRKTSPKPRLNHLHMLQDWGIN